MHVYSTFEYTNNYTKFWQVYIHIYLYIVQSTTSKPDRRSTLIPYLPCYLKRKNLFIFIALSVII